MSYISKNYYNSTMKNETLYRKIEKAERRIFWAYLESSVDAPSIKLREYIEKAGEEELDIVRKGLIKKFAEGHQGVADVLDENATFYSYGKPIIEHVRKVEERYRDRRFCFVPKRTLLGKDRTFHTSDDAIEAIQYLREERIIDPNRFFTSRLIYPGAKKINDLSRSPEMAVAGLFLIATGVGSGSAYLGYQAGDVLGAVGGGVGGFMLTYMSGMGLFALGDCTTNGIPKQREKFEKALKSLDSDVKNISIE